MDYGSSSSSGGGVDDRVLRLRVLRAGRVRPYELLRPCNTSADSTAGPATSADLGATSAPGSATTRRPIAASPGAPNGQVCELANGAAQLRGPRTLGATEAGGLGLDERRRVVDAGTAEQRGRLGLAQRRLGRCEPPPAMPCKLCRRHLPEAAPPSASTASAAPQSQPLLGHEPVRRRRLRLRRRSVCVPRCSASSPTCPDGYACDFNARRLRRQPVRRARRASFVPGRQRVRRRAHCVEPCIEHRGRARQCPPRVSSASTAAAFQDQAATFPCTRTTGTRGQLANTCDPGRRFVSTTTATRAVQRVDGRSVECGTGVCKEVTVSAGT